MKKRIYKIVSISLIFTILFSFFMKSNIVAGNMDTEGENVFADLAFPTAEGFGRFANGFRGGKVVAVTNLNYEGEGSLRWALEEVSGPRIIVFKVGGVINISYFPIDIAEGSVYIAGQTAPGDGITITGEALNIGKDEDVVVRYLRIRPGRETQFGLSAISVGNSANVIIDHCSLSWGALSGVAVRNSQNVTVQNSIISETIGYFGNYDHYYPNACSGIELNSENCSFYRNLITNISNKVWAFSYSETTSYPGDRNDYIDIRNNVVYNWYAGSRQTDGISGDVSKNTQFVNNYYKKGEGTDVDTLLSLTGKGYVAGNKLVSNKGEVMVDSDSENPWSIVSEESFPEGRSFEPLFDADVNTMTADDAYEYVLENAGAVLPKRDYIDSRYVSEVGNGTHTYSSYGRTPGIIHNQEDAEGYPDNSTFKGGKAPVDTDNDGMPDEWELKHGLNPENYYDACQVYLSDEGYTNIELYINELAGDPVKYSDNPKIQYTPAIPTPEPTATAEITETPEITASPEVTVTPVATTTVIPTATLEADKYLKGDVNGDGKVNAEDALAVLKHAAKIELLVSEEVIKADVECDEKIDASDALAILKIAAKIE